MKRTVLRPVIPPPKIDVYSHLSPEAQETLKALDIKYHWLIKDFEKRQASNAANYYRSIYESTFKRDKETNLFRYKQYDGDSTSNCSASTSGEFFHDSYVDNTSGQSFKKSKIIKTDPGVKCPSKWTQNSSRQPLCTEVLLTHRPSDEELAQSILSLTQRTSALESPQMDFDLDDSDFEKTRPQKTGKHSSNSGIDLLPREHTHQEDIHKEPFEKNQKTLTNCKSDNLEADDANIFIKDNAHEALLQPDNPAVDMQCTPEKRKDPMTSPLMCSLSQPYADENPCSSPILSTSNKYSSNEVTETVNFDLNVSDYDIDSPYGSTSSVSKNKAVLELVESPLVEDTEDAIDEESPLFIKNEIPSQSPQQSNVNLMKKKTQNSEQTTLDDYLLKRGEIKPQNKVQREKLPLPQSCIAESTGGPSKVKRKKSGFRPPPTTKNDETTARRESLIDLVDFSRLNSQQKGNVLESLGSSTTLTLTALFNDDTALCSSFCSTVDNTKIRGIAVLTSETCNLIPSALFQSEQIRNKILELLMLPELTKIICNCKEFLLAIWELLKVSNKSGIPCANLQDPCIATWLLDPEQQPTSFSQMCAVAGVVCVNDDNDWIKCLQVTPLLMESLKSKLIACQQWALYTEIEMRLLPILVCMESRVISIDTSAYVRFSDILKKKLARLEESIYKEAGHSFIINSHIQLRQVLYEELKLDQKLPPKTKIKKTCIAHLKSTSEASLNQLVDVHPLPSLVLEYRQLQKLKSTYVDGMMAYVHNETLRTHWDQTAAATGRLTSHGPNIQAVPKTAITVTDYEANYIIGSKNRSEAKIHVREPFESRKGYVLLAADFQQIELRILAHLSEDSNLLSTFWQPNAEDVFNALAAKWQDKAVETVTYAEREQTKRIVYSVMYGVGKERLAGYLKVKPDVAKCLMSSFLTQFPAIDRFTKKCYDFAKEFGFTQTVCERRRYFPHINSQSPILRAQAQRQAVNFCVQGSAADICKLAMLSVEEIMQKNDELDCRLLFQIHDELIWEVLEDHLQQVKGLIQEAMENIKSLCGKFCNLQVPLAVSIRSGFSWACLSSSEHPNDTDGSPYEP